ncbi:MAG: hypothetical protein ACKOA0_07900, partial [Burkholderiaceae bacterium]
MQSNAQGSLVSLDYGSVARISLMGTSPTLHVSGDLNLRAIGDFARTTLLVSHADSNSTINGAIDGSLQMVASGYGSRVAASFADSTSPSISIGGDLLAVANGAGAAISLEAGAAIKTSGNIFILADSLGGARFGGFAFVSVARENGGDQVINVNAIRASDIAVLRINNLSYGGNFYLGMDGGSGTVYLRIDQAQAANIKIQYTSQGFTNT